MIEFAKLFSEKAAIIMRIPSLLHKNLTQTDCQHRGFFFLDKVKYLSNLIHLTHLTKLYSLCVQLAFLIRLLIRSQLNEDKSYLDSH